MGHHLGMVFNKIMPQKNLMEKLLLGMMELLKLNDVLVINFLNYLKNLVIVVKS